MILQAYSACRRAEPQPVASARCPKSMKEVQAEMSCRSVVNLKRSGVDGTKKRRQQVKSLSHQQRTKVGGSRSAVSPSTPSHAEYVMDYLSDQMTVNVMSWKVLTLAMTLSTFQALCPIRHWHGRAPGNLFSDRRRSQALFSRGVVQRSNIWRQRTKLRSFP